MIVRLPRATYRGLEDVHHILLMSDLHIGSATCDKSLIRSELEWARANKARVFIAGDVFDFILPKDHKRYNPSRLDPELSRSDAVLNASLDLGTKILKPYADLIDVIGCGNHETALTRWHSADPTAFLVERLSTPKHTVRHGAYRGYIVMPFRRETGGGTAFRIWYHHGAGGSAPVTHGMINFNRAATWVRDADVLWMGHTHWRFAHPVAEQRLPESGDTERRATVWHIQTGAYDGQPEPDLDEHGNYRQDWAKERNFAPQGPGGAKIAVRVCARDNSIRAEVTL